MFTGIVEEMGEVMWLKRSAGATELRIGVSRELSKGIRKGDSLAVNGCCLTTTSIHKEQLLFDVLEETLRCTNLGRLRAGDGVNLERPLRADGRLGGHFVQGHVDAAAEVVSHTRQGEDSRLEVAIPEGMAHFLAYKGSVAVNGVSLTVAEVLEKSFAIWLIPHTRAVTNLGKLETGDMVNLEADILAKYLERMRQAH